MAAGGQVNERNDAIRNDLVEYIRSQLGDRQDLFDRVVPSYAPLTRRPVVDNGWYAALTRPNVELVTDEVARLVEGGIETTDGQVREVDVIVTATGFEVVKYLFPGHYVGLDGVELHERWAPDGPRAYLGMMVPELPNLFMIYGPNSQPVSGGVSLPAWYQIWTGYVARCIVGILERGARSVAESRQAFDDYNAELDKAASQLILLTDEGSVERNYYVNEHGRLQVNSPFESPDYYDRCSAPDWDDLVVR
jgi:4-hydroxyacetophenone monooxygenase